MLRILSFAVCVLTSHAFAHEFISGVVTKNVDGDTIWIESKAAEGVKKIKIRMIGIDTPETNMPAPGGVMGQGEFGKAASALLESLAPVGTWVTLDQRGLDRYKRSLGTVFLENGKDVNREMVEQGRAIPYILCEGKQCDADFIHDATIPEYIESCRHARQKGIGVFDPKNPLTEMPFEFRMRVQHRKPERWVGDFETMEFFKPTDYRRVDVCQRIFFSTPDDGKKIGFWSKEY